MGMLPLSFLRQNKSLNEQNVVYTLKNQRTMFVYTDIWTTRVSTQSIEIAFTWGESIPLKVATTVFTFFLRVYPDFEQGNITVIWKVTRRIVHYYTGYCVLASSCIPAKRQKCDLTMPWLCSRLCIQQTILIREENMFYSPVIQFWNCATWCLCLYGSFGKGLSSFTGFGKLVWLWGLTVQLVKRSSGRQGLGWRYGGSADFGNCHSAGWFPLDTRWSRE